eukprot:4175993-Pyramimonas_sp.AAC.1
MNDNLSIEAVVKSQTLCKRALEEITTTLTPRPSGFVDFSRSTVTQYRHHLIGDPEMEAMGPQPQRALRFMQKKWPPSTQYGAPLRLWTDLEATTISASTELDGD